MPTQTIKLQKYLADCGFCSRRAAEELIKADRVTVNDRSATTGQRINPAKDKIKVDDKSIILNSNKKYVYIALNKPVGYITSTTNMQGDSVLDLIDLSDRKKFGRLYPVGRLDKDSEGLVLLTNDGQLTNILTHPRFEHEKEYEIVSRQMITESGQETLKKGMKIKGQKMGGLTITNQKKSGKHFIATGILKEGKNRQIKKMLGNLGYDIINLKRVRIGKLKLGSTPMGSYRLVKKEEIIDG